jgi:phage repressor protein C with HTH and peptisase S24 domain
VRKEAPDPAFVERLKLAVDRIGKAKRVQELTGIPARSLSDYVNGHRALPTSRLPALARAAGVSLDWLLTGTEPRRADPPPIIQLPWRRGDQPAAPPLPVTGLAECGMRGWFSEYRLAVVTARPRDLEDPEAFAVVAVGESMVPRGIRPGFLCLCSPAAALARDTVVYVEKVDGSASLKEWLGEEAGFVILRGWLPPEDGRQESYEDRIARSTVARIAPVVYIKLTL